jgi:hypothetical protein
MSITTKNTTLVADQKVLLGIAKYFSTVTTLTVGSVSYTPVTLKAVFQGEVDALNALDSLRAQLKEQVAARRTMRTQVSTVRKALRSYILGTYGAQAVQVLDDFGMTVPKTPGPKTTQTKANAVVKNLATRKARNTMGKKQKLSVVGTPAGSVDLHALADGPAAPPAHAASPPATANGAAPVIPAAAAASPHSN